MEEEGGVGRKGEGFEEGCCLLAWVFALASVNSL